MSAQDLTSWVGKTEQAHEFISFNLLKRIAATFDEPVPGPNEALPLLWHWCFFQEPVVESALGEDGHPARGGFLPPADDRNRMWAGSRLEFFQPLRVGAEASRLSTITQIEEKLGRTGKLLFVTVRHDYLQDGTLCLRDVQDIVYRQATPPKLSNGEALDDGQWSERISPSPVLLFRYSAVTFNGHRIHYDVPYVTQVEHYPQLVVHGPLIATLNLRAFCRAHPQVRVRSFSFRGVRPLLAGAPFQVGGRILGPGHAQVWAGNESGAAQLAHVTFD